MIQELQNLLSEILQEMGVSDIVPTVTVTVDPSHGDYATNVAFVLAKKWGTSPIDAASRVAMELAKDMPPSLEKVDVAKPGFINLTLNAAYLRDRMLSRVQGSELKPLSALFAHKKVMIEFTDPNPFKEFHIGHLYSNIVGESISRLLEAVGAEAKRVCYQGDVGLHVAKSLYGLRHKLREEGITIPDLDQRTVAEKVKFLGQAYAFGATKYEDDEEAKKEITEINKQVYASAGSAQVEKDEAVMQLYTKGREWSLEYFETIYRRLGTKFWQYYFESEAGPIGLDLVKKYLAKGIFQESNGAVIFPGEDHGLHTRVFINSLGLPTYEAKELGLAPTKYKDYPYDQSIIITGNEIDEYFRVLLKALSLISPDLAAKTMHISHGMVRLPEGKMSSRTGKVLTGEWLLDEAVTRSMEKIREVKASRGSTPQETDKGVEPLHETTQGEEQGISELVGVGAVKWALLRTGIGKDIEFSFEQSVSFEGNSGPYLQYTYVRTRSVLDKAEQLGVQPLKGSYEGLNPLSSEERQILVHLTRYNDIIVEAAEKYSPHVVTTYLFELAQLFNNFYQKHSILKLQKGEDASVAQSLDTKSFRLALTKSVGITIKSGLSLLGIQTPERM